MKPAELARLTVEKYITDKNILKHAGMLEGVDLLQAGVFVSIKTADKELRGCIGTIFPTKSSINEEIIHNAIAAATKDPRFDRIEKHELSGLIFSVDVLYPPLAVSSIEELDPKVYGIIVIANSGRQALLLPDLEGIDTVEAQLAICKNKAGIPVNEPVAVQKFKVERFFE